MFWAVISPFEDTVTTFLLLVDQVTFLEVPCNFNVYFVPDAIIICDLFNLIRGAAWTDIVVNVS